MRSSLKAYRAVELGSADKRMLVVLMFEAARRNLEQGRQHMLQRNYEAKHRCLTKAQEIMTELQLALDAALQLVCDAARELKLSLIHI